MSILGLVITLPIVIGAGLVGLLVVSMTPPSKPPAGRNKDGTPREITWREKVEKNRERPHGDGVTRQSYGMVSAARAAELNEAGRKAGKSGGNPF